VILAIGQSSDLSFLKPEDGIEVTPRGTIKVDLETMATTAPGIFAGGDVALGPRIFIEGVETGHRAARGIHEYVSGQKLKMVKLGSWTALDHRGQFLSREGPKGRSLPIVNPNYLRTPRKEPPSLPIDRRVGIAEIELGYDQDGAVEQASRCVRCGINPIFDGDKCILCGGCVDVCPEYCFRMVSLEEMEEAPELSRLVESRFGLTLRAFQENASYRSKGSAMIMDTDRCIRCSLCALRCPTGAISMESFKFTEELA
jgi:NAD-dependent dihydropyrimidine dehydrogenase PreA subunit